MSASKRIRRYIGLPALMTSLIILSSCVSMELESEFNEDGGATHSMALTLDMSDLDQLGDLGEGEIDPFEDFDDIEQEANEQGFRVERIEDGDIVGVRLTQEVDDSSNLGEQLNTMFNAGSTEGEEVAPFSGSFEKDGDDFHLNLTVDGASLTQGAGEGLGDTEDLGFGLEAIFEFNYTARMPGEIDEDATNGIVGSDGSVTWELPLDSSETLTAASSTGGDSSNLLLILVVGGILILGLIALAAVAFFIFMNRRGSPQVTAPEGGTPVSPSPPAATSDQPTQPSIPTVDEQNTPPDDPQPPRST